MSLLPLGAVRILDNLLRWKERKNAQKSEAEKWENTEDAVRLSYASPKSAKEIADDLGIPENLLCNGGESIPLMVIRQSSLRLKKKRELRRQLPEAGIE
jgi:hypothetical protein